MNKFGNFMTGLGLVAVLVATLWLWIRLPWPVVLAVAVLFALWMALSRQGLQASSVTAVGISTLRQRLGSSSVIVIGIAGVVAVLVALLAMGEGYSETLRRTGSPDTAIVMRGASASEVMSVLERDNVVVIPQAVGIARASDGKPIASPELVVAANLPLKGGAEDEVGSVQLRGIGEQAWRVRPNVKVIAGRKFKPGLHELMVGQGAEREFAGVQVGQQIKLGNQTWTVVGEFASGDALDSELWADANVVSDVYRRGGSRNSVTLQLTSPQAFDAFKARLEADPRLKVDVSTTLDYFSKQSEGTSKMIKGIGITVGVIMAIGAIFGALNCMFAAVAMRAREIATLRAIGFRGTPVVVAIMLETMLLALIGGVLGGLLAWLIFNGYTASTLAAGSVGKLSFQFSVTPALLWDGLKWALAIGFIGGLFPAVRAARLPVTTALREL
jgi:putative ABC transport system permease protein